MFIFVTSHPGFAVNGFELDAVDYIIKPVNKLRLVKAVNKAIKQINSSVEAIETKKVTDIEELPYNQSFFIKENNNIVKLNTCDVLYIESLSDFSKFYLTNNRSHLVLANLKSVESQLPQKIFQRVHRQFVINMDKISTLTPTEIELTDDKIVPLGSTYKQTLMDLIENRIISR
jgi:DNA-binding LytR/AlgR family response regulator